MQTALLLIVGLLLLLGGAELMIRGAARLAAATGLSPLVVGLTVVAFGTSAPELAIGVDAALRGAPAIAVGNVVGSNIFNLSVVLGASAAVAAGGMPVSAAARTFDLPVMTAVAFACLPIFFTGHRIARWEGGLFLGYYVAYTAYLLLEGTGHDAAPLLGRVTMGFVLPLTAITLAVVTVRAWQVRRGD